MLTRAELLRRAAFAAAGLRAVRAAGAAAATGAVRSFHSRPDLHPPVLRVVKHAGHVAPGLLFLAPTSGPGQRGVMVVDDSGELVYFRPTTPATAMNVRVGSYRGEPVVTWWEGKTEHGFGVGTHAMLNSAYDLVARTAAGEGLGADLHEWLLTDRNTALCAAWELESADLRPLGGKAKWPVFNGVVQELEVPSGKVLFEWRSLDHVALAESYQRIGPRFDYFHLNSIDLDADGNLLVSARNTWAVYKVDRGSGKVLWRLGGKKSDFTMGRGAQFAWQHDARHHDRTDGLISIFDNGDDPQVHRQSRGIVLALDHKRRTATLRREYTHDPAVLAHALGSVQLQPNGNVLVGWGASPWFTEYAADGTVLLDATLPRGGESYRTLRFPWVGRPSQRPALAAAHGALWASWNGSTETASWQVHAGKSTSSLVPRPAARRAGFETRLELPRGARYAAVVALDAHGRQLSRSATIRL